MDIPHAQAKWMSVETLKRKFPYLLVKAWMLLYLNKEELGHREGQTPSFSTQDEEESSIINI